MAEKEKYPWSYLWEPRKNFVEIVAEKKPFSVVPSNNKKPVVEAMPEIKKINWEGFAFLAQNEGEMLHPYRDSVGIPTIGIGCTYYENGRRVKMTDPAITKQRSADLFKTVVKTYEMAVWSVTRDDLKQNEFNALVSFCYNVGVGGFKGSTLLRRINAYASKESIASAFMMWTKQKQLKGRRIREYEYFLNIAIG